MNAKRPESPATNRMFRTIVLMGSGLALGCGGVAQIDGGNGGAPSGSGGAAGSPQPGQVGGSSNASAGNTAVSAGGSLFITIGGGSSVAGAPSGVAGAPAVANPSCPFSQWDCTKSPTAGYCSSGENSQIAADCFCNSNRPASGADCKPGYSYACLMGVLTPTSNSTTSYQCSCTPTPADGSSCEICDTVYEVHGECDTNTPNEVLCGCTLVLLK